MIVQVMDDGAEVWIIDGNGVGRTSRDHTVRWQNDLLASR
jgi:hypothetical protein